jgi:nucleoside-diphosphate-sugar epimerase
MAAAAKKLVVCGGSGFLGSRICKHAVARGWEVTSIRYVTKLCGLKPPRLPSPVSRPQFHDPRSTIHDLRD